MDKLNFYSTKKINEFTSEYKKEELEKKIRQKQKQIRKQTKSFSEEQTGRNVKDQMIRAQKNLVRYIYKIEKGFKNDNKLKEELIEKIKYNF